jgi:serine/threonine protein kinase
VPAACQPWRPNPAAARCRSDGFKVDIWAAGVILYTLVANDLPFGYESAERGVTRVDVFRNICAGTVHLRAISMATGILN